MLQLTALRLVSETTRRKFAAELTFRSGLNVIMAPNSSGKSTCLQAVIYVLGLERMLGARLEVPLPYAMREKIHAIPKTPYEAVVRSFVELTIENGEASVLVRRDVVGGADRKLIRTTLLSGSSAEFVGSPQRDFFVLDGGAARDGAGFHRFLAAFIGWRLPTVPQFDGREVPLYVETLFPMLFVEQKRGWSTIQGPLPTMFSIQDLNRRVLEFLLDLRVGHVRRRATELRTSAAQLLQRWKDLRREATEAAGPGLRVTTLNQEPTQAFANDPKIEVDALADGEWLPVEELLEEAREELSRLEAREVPQTEEISADMEEELSTQRATLENLTAEMEVLRREWLSGNDDVRAVRHRITTLQIDLARNQDARKLKSLGSVLGSAATDHVCPTCHQKLEAELLPTVPVRAMALEENITFIKAQLEVYGSSLAAVSDRLHDIDRRYSALSTAATEARHRIRELRQALVKPSSSPSRTLIERIVRLQARIGRLTLARENVDALVDEAQSVARQLLHAREELSKLKSDRLGTDDGEKLEKFLGLIQRQCDRFGLTTFSPGEIKLSEDNFRPMREIGTGGESRLTELGFELSASDGIRLKWAYYLALMAVAGGPNGQHPGLVVFDEPGQQAVEEESLRSFFAAAGAIAEGRQIIAAVTTEKASGFIDEVKEAGGHVQSFEGLVLQPIDG